MGRFLKEDLGTDSPWKRSCGKTGGKLSRDKKVAYNLYNRSKVSYRIFLFSFFFQFSSPLYL